MRRTPESIYVCSSRPALAATTAPEAATAAEAGRENGGSALVSQVFSCRTELLVALNRCRFGHLLPRPPPPPPPLVLRHVFVGFLRACFVVHSSSGGSVPYLAGKTQLSFLATSRITYDYCTITAVALFLGVSLFRVFCFRSALPTYLARACEMLPPRTARTE